MRTHHRHDTLDRDPALRRPDRAEPAADRFHEPSNGMIAGLMRLHQTHGNQAVQRLIQRDGILPEWTIGDWKIGPPKPTTETDDRYDTEENRRRAEQKESDERGEVPTPPKWWQDKKPGPAPKKGDKLDPLNWPKKVTPSGGEIELPPPGPDERGDYPYPTPIEPEDAQYA